MHTLPLQIRFNDVDQMGHVNNAVIMEYFDLGKSHYFADAGLPPESGDFTVMVVHVEVDFHRQIHYHDHIAVTTHVVRFGNKSLHVEQQVIDTTSHEVCATCRTVMAGYCRTTATSAPIPEAYKEAIRRIDPEDS